MVITLASSILSLGVLDTPVTPKSAITYRSPDYYDHSLNHSKKPHLSHRTGGNFPLHRKQLNAGASGRYGNNIFTLDLMTIHFNASPRHTTLDNALHSSQKEII